MAIQQSRQSNCFQLIKPSTGMNLTKRIGICKWHWTNASSFYYVYNQIQGFFDDDKTYENNQLN